MSKGKCYTCHNCAHLSNDDKHVMCSHKQSSKYGEIVSANYSCTLYEPDAECFVAAIMDVEKYTSGCSIYSQNQI